MNRELPLFPVSVVGSWPRPAWLREATRKRAPDLGSLEDEATLLAIKHQEDAGVDIVSDGEQRRDNFYSFVADRIDGIKLMTMAELLDHVEDKAGFENLLNALDVPAFAISNPTIVDKLKVTRSLAMDDYQFLRRHTDRAVKVTLPGPYLLSRSMWVKSLSAEAYPTREELNTDIVEILHRELVDLAAAGVDVVQFDEPVLTELTLAGKSATRTFMCAALAASADPAAELDLAVELINRVVDGVEGVTTALHVCRGNWSQQEDVLLSGAYDPLIPTLAKMRVDQFVLEYATPRAGSLEALRGLPESARLGFGAVNPRTAEIEEPHAVAERVRTLTEILAPERILLNPDCGFGTFADRPMASAQVASQKLESLAGAARLLRGEA